MIKLNRCKRAFAIAVALLLGAAAASPWPAIARASTAPTPYLIKTSLVRNSTNIPTTLYQTQFVAGLGETVRSTTTRSIPYTASISCESKTSTAAQRCNRTKAAVQVGLVQSLTITPAKGDLKLAVKVEYSSLKTMGAYPTEGGTIGLPEVRRHQIATDVVLRPGKPVLVFSENGISYYATLTRASSAAAM